MVHRDEVEFEPTGYRGLLRPGPSVRLPMLELADELVVLASNVQVITLWEMLQGMGALTDVGVEIEVPAIVVTIIAALAAVLMVGSNAADVIGGAVGKLEDVLPAVDSTDDEMLVHVISDVGVDAADCH